MLKQLNGQTIHCLSILEGTMSNSAQIETLHDVIAVKNELIKSIREIWNVYQSSLWKIPLWHQLRNMLLILLLKLSKVE